MKTEEKLKSTILWNYRNETSLEICLADQYLLVTKTKKSDLWLRHASRKLSYDYHNLVELKKADPLPTAAEGARRYDEKILQPAVLPHVCKAKSKHCRRDPTPLAQLDDNFRLLLSPTQAVSISTACLTWYFQLVFLHRAYYKFLKMIYTSMLNMPA